MFKRVDVLLAAIIVALLYVLVLLGFQLRHGASEWAAGQNLNILGDSIGGLTAPLALIFLIAAVIIQRQELNLTKAELAKSAEALENQVEEQKLNREYMRQQTDLMRKEAEASAITAHKTYKLSLFDRRFQVLSEVKDLRRRIQGDAINWHDAHEQVISLNSQAFFLFSSNVSFWFNHILELFEEAAFTYHRLSDLGQSHYDDGGNLIDNSKPYLAAREQLFAKRAEILKSLQENTLMQIFASSMAVTD